MSPRPTPLLCILAAASLTLTLTGCEQILSGFGGGGTTGSTDSDGSSSAFEEQSDEDSTDEDATSGSCPVGSWTLVNDSWASSLEGIFAATDLAGASVRVTGSVDLEWGRDGAYQLTSHSSQYDISGNAGGTSFFMRVLHDGTESGIWAQDASGVWLSAGAPTDNVVSVVSMGETESSLLDIAEQDESPDLFDGAISVECTATGMVTTVIDDGALAAASWVRRG